MTEPLLRVRDLSVAFEATAAGATVDAVERVSFDLTAGVVAALVGESGSGKSAAAAACLGLLPRGGRIVSGSVRFCGQELVGAPRALLREVRGRGLGLVLQDPDDALLPVRSVGAQLVETLRRRAGLPAAEARGEALRWLERVGIADAPARWHAAPHELSGGMRQRVALALALCLTPRVLVADEPTTALDVTVQRQILALLRAHVEAGAGRSVLLVTHDLGVVAECADVVWVMYAGRLVETGPVEAMFDRPRHPYTRALLAARLGLPAARAPRARLPTLPGQPPGPEAVRAAGCAFRSRCPIAVARCASETPTLDGDAHRVACHRAEAA